MTHQGPLLKVNEDGFDVDFESKVFMIFDGFGGAHIGDKAVKFLSHEIKSYFTKLSFDPNATMPLYYHPRNLIETNALLNAIMNAHQQLYTQNSVLPLPLRGGASAIISVLADEVMSVIGIGNCEAYHFRLGHTHHLIQSDSFHLHQTEVFGRKNKMIPMSGFGLYSELNYTQRDFKIQSGDQLVFLTDGIHSQVSSDEIQHLFLQHQHNYSELMNAILKLSNTRGNLDNQTIMILEF